MAFYTSLHVFIYLSKVKKYTLSWNCLLEVGFKPNSTPQNWFVRWGLHLTYILWNCLISSRCRTSNTARALLLGANVVVHQWGDAILIVCYFVNRMPSSLDNEVPYSIVSPNEHRFHISPQVLGCVFCTSCDSSFG